MSPLRAYSAISFWIALTSPILTFRIIRLQPSRYNHAHARAPLRGPPTRRSCAPVPLSYPVSRAVSRWWSRIPSRRPCSPGGGSPQRPLPGEDASRRPPARSPLALSGAHPPSPPPALGSPGGDLGPELRAVKGHARQLLFHGGGHLLRPSLSPPAQCRSGGDARLLLRRQCGVHPAPLLAGRLEGAPVPPAGA